MTDNGCGIQAETVTDICDFSVLVSDKARYRGPTRGAQGNAFKTLLGIPFALGVTEPITIASAGVRHELSVSTDAAGGVVVTRNTVSSDRVVGTSVTVPLPADTEVDPQRWACGAALVNPDAVITVVNPDYPDYRGDDNKPVLYNASDRVWST